MEKKLQKTYLTYYNLLITQDFFTSLLITHHQILSIIFLKEFIELNLNTENKKLKFAESNISTATVFLNT